MKLETRLNRIIKKARESDAWIMAAKRQEVLNLAEALNCALWTMDNTECTDRQIDTAQERIKILMER